MKVENELGISLLKEWLNAVLHSEDDEEQKLLSIYHRLKHYDPELADDLLDIEKRWIRSLIGLGREEFDVRSVLDKYPNLEKQVRTELEEEEKHAVTENG